MGFVTIRNRKDTLSEVPLETSDSAVFFADASTSAEPSLIGLDPFRFHLAS
jgi:hypothetical protein